MMSSVDSTFRAWLLIKLNTMKVDGNIFLNYILSILEGDETRVEKLETLQSVLIETGCSEEEINKQCVEILDRYQLELSKVKEASKKEDVENVDEKLARLLESNVQIEETYHACKYSDEELKIREAILSKYSNLQTDELEDDDGEVATIYDLENNTNGLSICQAEKEKREKAKLNNQKKERDKMDREKQKLTQQEKKEARRKRAQKVEHHRK